MNRPPVKLHTAARTCREMAAECTTEEAREALLQVADSLDGEASAKKQSIGRRMGTDPVFYWTK